MGVSWAYRLQGLAFRTWRLFPGSLRNSLRGLYRLWSFRFNEISKGTPGGPAIEVESERPGKAIVCFSIIDWEMRIQRPQQLLARLAAKGFRVYYVRKDFKSGRGVTRVPIANDIMGLILPRGTQPNIYEGGPTRGDVEAWLRALDTLRQSEELDNVISFVEWPFWAEVALEARTRWGWNVIYDCLDEHSAFSTASSAVLDLEQRLIRESSLVLATSRLLFDKCRKLARRCELLENATDFQHFNRLPKRHILRHVRSPIIGYYGALAEWFAPELIEVAALAHPEWNFVLIGLNSGADLRPIQRLRNVLLLGERSYSTLPAYLHRFDVATIPFKVNDLTRATNPIKFYEYLSVGKPVVAANLPGLARFGNLVYGASSPAEFTAQLEVAVAEHDPERTAARLALARANTWDERAARLELLLRGL